MPLSSSVLHSGLSQITPSKLQTECGPEWVRAFVPYIQASAPGAANPGLVEPNLHSTLGSALSSLVPGTFPNTVQTALIGFWTSFIPTAIQGMTVVAATPTLVGPLRIAMEQASGCLDMPSAMLPIAEAIDAWTRTIMYGTPGTGPTTPLV
jgi:hypothetical protein